MKNFRQLFFSLITLSIIFGSLLFGAHTRTVTAQTAALTFPDITTALNTKLPNKYFKSKADLMNWLIGEIQKRKVDKPLTPDREADLRQSGATDQLIAAIKANSPTFKNPSNAKPPYRIEFVKIPAGSFMMGSDGNYDEKPIHRVTISKDIWMQKTEVTQAQWKATMGDLPTTKCYDTARSEDFLGDNKPVFCVSWENAQQFIQRLNDKKDGYKYRLPTEAEWEYAARAGTTGDYAGDLDQMAWYGADEESGHPHDVATKKPNAWGLYDMHGNVSEWVKDWYDGSDYYAASPLADPTGATASKVKAIRGGAYISDKFSVRSAVRITAAPSERSPYIGFRLVREK